MRPTRDVFKGTSGADVNDKERRLRAFDEFIRAYEAEHGLITEAEMDEAWRKARQRAISIRARADG